MTNVTIRKSLMSVAITVSPFFLSFAYVMANKTNWWIGVLFVTFAYFSLYFLIRLINMTPAITMDDDGIYFDQPGIGRIRWVDITNVTVRGYPRGGAYLDIELKNGSHCKALVVFLELTPEKIRKLMLNRLSSRT